jgi:hypothetical protein
LRPIGKVSGNENTTSIEILGHDFTGFINGDHADRVVEGGCVKEDKMEMILIFACYCMATIFLVMFDWRLFMAVACWKTGREMANDLSKPDTTPLEKEWE